MKRHRLFHVSVKTVLCDVFLARKHHSVPVCVCFQWSLYLLWCVDHTNVVSELQRSQDGGEDWENKGSRHCLKTHSNGTFRRIFTQRKAAERPSDFAQLSSCDPWWLHRPLYDFKLNFPTGLHGDNRPSRVFASPGGMLDLADSYIIHRMVIFHDGFWRLIMYFNLLDQNKPALDSWSIDILKMRVENSNHVTANRTF